MARTSDSPSAPVVLDSEARQRVSALLRAHGCSAQASSARWRGDARSDSDLDLLIAPPDNMTIFGLSALALALEDLLQRPVDLVTSAALNPRLSASVYTHYDELFAENESPSSPQPAQAGFAAPQRP